MRVSCGVSPLMPIGLLDRLTPIGVLDRLTPIGLLDRLTPIGLLDRLTPIAHCLHKIRKQIIRIMRAGTRFGVILH